MDRLSSMPDEVNELILSWLDVPEVTRMKLVSTGFRNLVSSPRFPESYNRLSVPMKSDWSVSHVVNDINPVAGFLLWVRDEDGREIEMPLMPLLQGYIPDNGDDVSLTLVCVWGSVALFILNVREEFEMSCEEEIFLLAVNPFNRQVRDVSHEDGSLGFTDWRHVEMAAEDDNGTNYIVAYVDWGLYPVYREFSSVGNMWLVPPIDVLRMNDEDLQQMNTVGKRLVVEVGELTCLVLMIDGWPVFTDDETSNLITGNLDAFNPEPVGGWVPRVYRDIGRATNGLRIEMRGEVLTDGSFVLRIDQIFLLGVAFPFEYQLISTVNPHLLPDYHVVFHRSTIEFVNEKARYSMIVTEAVVEGEVYRGHGHHILLYTYDTISGVWSSSRVSLGADVMIEGGPFYTSRLTL